SITLSYNFPQKPGLYTANTLGYNLNNGKPEIDFLTAAVVPYDLSKNSDISINGNLLPARWERYYFKTVPGMSELDITLTVLEQDTAIGRALVYIYDPDGYKVYEDAAGADYLSLRESTSFKTPKPKSGIWEVIVACDYNLSDFGADRTIYELNVQAAGVFTNVKELAIAAPRGQSYISREIMLKNGSKPFSGRLEGIGLAKQTEGIVLTKVLVKDGEFTKGPNISVPENAMSLSIDVFCPDACNGDVDLYLYWKNPITGLYEEAANSTKIDVLHESIYLTNPKPGEYVVYIDGFSIPDTVADLYIRTQVLKDKKDVFILDISGELEPEQQWQSKIYINIPPVGTSFTGYIAVKDENGDEISQIPLKLVVGKKPLTVQRLSDGSITVREKDTNNPVDTIILVNGIEYTVINGKAVMPRDITIETIEIYDERFEPVIIVTTMEDSAV
ncbi:MAG: tripeptidyl-peptidase II, partial [Thermoanaerobacteraceae bacterium]|nr:tripeptidyl-peptidase II [Thermoanaerobacteraceae bacterium]